MTSYRMYVFDAQNHIETRHDLAAPDDLSALEQAKALASESIRELWKGARLIARIGHDGEAVP
ncbi:MAG: hypothetical protein H7X89_03905 [Rhizobiales bacterium]|nr:hypothetical protein [Hyphomicrobiales bacterium]